MRLRDYSLNDFEIKSIKAICKNRILDFEIEEVGKPYDMKYTKIKVFNIEGEFCQEVFSYDLSKTLQWFKPDINTIIEIINNSVVSKAPYAYMQKPKSFNLEA